MDAAFTGDDIVPKLSIGRKFCNKTKAQIFDAIAQVFKTSTFHRSIGL